MADDRRQGQQDVPDKRREQDRPRPAPELAESHEHIGPVAVDMRAVGGKGIKVRLTLGPALIDLEATLEEIVQVVTRLTQEFTDKKIIE